MEEKQSKWLLEDEKCPHCNQITKKQRGITKQNLRRLLVPKWDLNELIITLLLIMFLVMGYLYGIETGQCRDWLKPMLINKDECVRVCDLKCKLIYESPNNTAANLLVVNLTNSTNITLY